MKYAKRIKRLEEYYSLMLVPVDADLVGLSDDELRVELGAALTRRAEIRTRRVAALAKTEGQPFNAALVDAEPSDDEIRAQFEEALAMRRYDAEEAKFKGRKA